MIKCSEHTKEDDDVRELSVVETEKPVSKYQKRQ